MHGQQNDKYTEMHGQQNIKKVCCLILFPYFRIQTTFSHNVRKFLNIFSTQNKVKVMYFKRKKYVHLRIV